MLGYGTVARSLDIRSDLPTPLPMGTAAQLRLLDEGAHLFLTAGYAETTMREIAAAAGMKAGQVSRIGQGGGDAPRKIFLRRSKTKR